MSSVDTAPRTATENRGGAVPAPRYSRAAEAHAWRMVALVASTIVIWVGFHLWTGVFITPRNLSNLAVQMTITSLLAAGLTWLLVAREIDLSVGALLALSAVTVMQLTIKHGWNDGLAVGFVVALGIGVGLFQGSIRVYLGIPSFIVTLAGFSYLRGAAYVISGAETVSGGSDVFYALANGMIGAVPSIVVILLLGAYGIYSWMRRYTNVLGPHVRTLRPVNVVVLGLGLAFAALGVWVFGLADGIPYPLALLFVVAFALDFVGRNTGFGRYVYAVGGNPESARRAGVKVKYVILMLFGMMGGLASIAGVLQASRLDAGPPNLGLFLALDAISASIVGGTSLFGGTGTILGAVVGALLMSSITNGLSLAGVNTFYQMMITGGLLLVAVSVDTAAQRRPR